MVHIVKRKKKGRPSKSDLARRNSDSPPVKSAEKDRQLRRSGRRRNVRYTFDFDDYIDEDFDYFDDDDDEDKERRDKKLMLLLQLHSSTAAESPPPSGTRRVSHAPTHSASSSDCGVVAKPSKKRKIDDEGDDSENNIADDYDDDVEVRSQKVEPKVIDSVPETQVDHSSGFWLPDNKRLELILDKLQKKDIYGVYAEPVDPEELPDYHEVIKNPMDFATVRKKLGSGKYVTLEQFENDVFLICENAMQYNSPDTIYYKQASSIQELARRKFQRLRTEVDRHEKEPKTEEKATSNSLCRKQTKKPIIRSLQEPVGSDFSSGATLAMAGDVANGSNIAQVAVFEKPSCVDKIIEGNLSSVDNIMDRGEEFQSGKGLILRPVRKVSGLDENRRATYNISIPTVTASESTFTTFEGESKQLVPVGLNADHSYAWSLARFAATLGPVAWKVASARIEQALPEGFKYGRGWVGEYEPLPTPVLSLGNHTVNDTVPLPRASDMRKEGRDVRAPISGQVHPVIRSTLAELPLSGLSEARPATTSSSSIQVAVKEEPSRLTSLNEKSSFISLPRTRHTDHRATYQQQNLQTNDFVEPKTKISKRVGLRSPTFVNQRSADVTVEKEILEALGTQTSRSGKTVSLQFASCKQLNVNGVPAGRVQNGQVGTNVMGGKMAAATSNSLKQNSGTVTQYSCGQEQGLSDPVQLMRMLAEKDQRQHSLNHSPNDLRPIVRSSPSVKKEDSSNAATAAARAWMSIGAGMVKPSAENTIAHSGQFSSGSLYNASCDRQPQLSRFRGEYPATVVQFHPDKSKFPLHTVVPQPVGECNEAQFQHQPMVFPQLVSPNLSRFQVQPTWRGLNPLQSQHRQKQESLPPDLNIGYQSSGSPVRQSSGVMIDSQQPDLALQL